MSLESAPPLEASLQGLASRPGVVWAALLDTTTGSWEIATRGTPPSQSDRTLHQVLLEATLSAAGALADRLQAGPTREFSLACAAGGLLVARVDSHRHLVIRHQSAAPLAVLRLALRAAAADHHPSGIRSSPAVSRETTDCNFNAPA